MSLYFEDQNDQVFGCTIALVVLLVCFSFPILSQVLDVFHQTYEHNMLFTIKVRYLMQLLILCKLLIPLLKKEKRTKLISLVY